VKKVSIVFGSLFLVFCLISRVFAQGIPEKRIAVIEKVVATGNYTRNVERHLSARIETLLQNAGWTTVARGTKYKDLIEEQNLQGIDPSTASQRNKIWGTTAIIKAYAEINISENSRNNSFSFGRWGSSGSCTNYIVRGVINLQTIDTITGETKPNVMVEKVISQSITTNSRLNTPYGSTGGSGSVGDTREVLANIVLDFIADEAIQKLSQQYSQVPQQKVVQQEQSAGLGTPNSLKMGGGEIISPIIRSDVVICSKKNSVVNLIIGNWSKTIKITDQNGILKISNIGSGKSVRAKIGNIQKTGQTPCQISF